MGSKLQHIHNDTEIWLPVKGFEEFYSVSSHGNVKSHDRYSYSHTSRIGLALRKGKMLKPSKTYDGYLSVCLQVHTVKKTKLVHRLVAGRFVENADNKPSINHKDCNKRNNHFKNLEWCTAKENSAHALKNGRCPSGENHPGAKVTKADVVEIRRLRSQAIPIKTIARSYDVSEQNIRDIANYKTWLGI